MTILSPRRTHAAACPSLRPTPLPGGVPMQGRQEAVLESLRRIQRFLEDNGAMLDAVNQSGARKRLDQTVTQIGSHAVAQVAGRRAAEGETAKQRTLRLAL